MTFFLRRLWEELRRLTKNYFWKSLVGINILKNLLNSLLVALFCIVLPTMCEIWKMFDHPLFFKEGRGSCPFNIATFSREVHYTEKFEKLVWEIVVKRWKTDIVTQVFLWSRNSILTIIWTLEQNWASEGKVQNPKFIKF